MSQDMNLENAKEIADKYLRFHQGEAWLFGTKGKFSDNKFLWVAKGKDEYTSGEVLKEAGGKLTVQTKEGKKQNFSNFLFFYTKHSSDGDSKQITFFGERRVDV